MLPRVDLPELILEVMGWLPAFAGAFTGISGGQSRMNDLDVTIAAALTAHALNVGYVPVISETVPALRPGRISHVDQNYLRPENYTLANAALIAAQEDIDLAQRWGGGLVAGIDGMRFVVPVRSIHARPNSKYFGPAWRDVAEHALRPGRRARRPGPVGNPARLAARDRSDL